MKGKHMGFRNKIGGIKRWLFAPTKDAYGDFMRGVETEHFRVQAMVEFHLSMTTMSHFVTEAECKAARDALQRVLEDLE
jgi:hypothetical protein